MTPPCLNCHLSPATSPLEPWESQGPCERDPSTGEPRLDCLRPALSGVLSSDPVGREQLLRWLRDLPDDAFQNNDFPALSAARPDTEPPLQASDCPAFPRWPEALRVDQPARQAQVWWVRGNYEAARASRPPLRFDVKAAQLEATIQLRANQSLPLVGGMMNYVALHSGPEGRITTSLDLRHNEIPLTLLSLLRFHDVQLELMGMDSLVDLDRISIGDFGDLHAIANVPTPLMFFLQPFMVPVPRPGFDYPTPSQEHRLFSQPGLFEACLNPHYSTAQPGTCPQPMLYPDRRHATAPLDLRVQSLLPARLQALLAPFLSEEQRAPQFFNLEDLLTRILGLRDLALPPAQGGGPDAQAWLNFVNSAELSLEFGELRDLFIPGAIDLGPSRASLQAHWEQGRGTLEVSDLFLQFEEMAYGNLEILGGQVTEGPPPDDASGVTIEPGIHAVFELSSQLLTLQANLAFDLELQVPGLGEVEAEGELSLETQWAVTEAGMRPVPTSSTLRLRHFFLRSRQSQEILLRDGDLQISDDPRSLEAADAIREFGLGPTWFLTLQGEDSHGRALALHGTLPVPLDASGLYDFSSFAHAASGDLAMQTSSLQAPPMSGEIHMDYRGSEVEEIPERRDLALNFDLDQGSAPLVQGGHVDLLWERQPEEGITDHQIRVFLSALLVQWGRFQLSGLESGLSLDLRRPSGDGRTEASIPSFYLRGNSRGHSQGLLQGPVGLEQDGSRALEILWDPRERRLDLMGLNLLINAQQLAVLPPAFLESLDLGNASLGVDGHLSGAFTLYFPEAMSDWHGQGDIRLRGDRQGDVYFLHPDGTMIQPPLIRDTHWRWQRITQLNLNRGYALGRFHLDLLLNPELLISGRHLRPHAQDSGTQITVYDQHGRVLQPYEIEASMPYDNQPATPAGFQNRIVDYLLALFRNYAGECRDSGASAGICGLVAAVCREAENPPHACEDLVSEGGRR